MSHETVARQRIELFSDGVTLRELTLDDAEAYFGLVDADREHLSQHGDTTADKYPNVFEVESSIIDQPDDVRRFGIWNQDDMMVGLIKLTGLDSDTQEVGYWIGKEHLRNGYAKRALASISDHALEDPTCARVVANVVKGNEGSRRTLEAAGYKLVGETETKWIFELEQQA